jgi:hypothetical protein
MSKINLFVFVESNENDPYFYGELCSHVLSGTGISHKILVSREIPTSSVGKTALLDLCDYLRNNSLLMNELKGKKTGILFFLDKDVDDLTNEQISSEHVVYTYYYDIEGHIVEHGDLIRGCAVAASMDLQEVARCIGDPGQWLRDAAKNWIDWVKFCVFVKISKLENCPLNYERRSQFHDPITEVLNHFDYDRSLDILKAKSGLSDSEFATKFYQISKIVEDLYQEGKHGKVFKGKWYKYFLDDQIRRLAKTNGGNVDGFAKHIFRYIAGTLDFTAAWTKHFTQPMKRVVDRLV